MNFKLTLFILISSLTLGNAQNLIVPHMTNDKPKAGLRVKMVPENFKGTGVYYSMYLPENYQIGKKYPIIVEYTGNEWKPSGSTGAVKDANLGYAIAKEIEAIWVVFPYVSGNTSVKKWWGNEDETISFALKNIRQICSEYGGNPSEVFLCGFSRGAIGVNYLGLYNDEIADVWLGFFTHDHYDGVKEWKGTDWGTPLGSYRQAAISRFKRIKGRNCLISQKTEEGDTTFETKKYIDENSLNKFAGIQYNLVPIKSVIPDIPSEFVPHEHTDKWLLFDSNYADSVIDWFARTIKTKPNTYSLKGIVKDSDNNPLSGLVIESGKTHFTITNEKGEYTLEGLVGGHRTISLFKQESDDLIETKEVFLVSNVQNLNFIILKK
ncbi:carboxypeptidase-like regulatory domain-containing protein [Flammeovirga sp. EKP202]|uniref:carboxypeptidase-like regulatory domain-containing protein n=1 Tax=Flammeovirga sp. EKP202 TaxID=2770592 RepID=UPI00165F1402|nr:carboxypeptidase-like regulatory domain-containing protein [Flammeovirga sp. EKP202]MBD0405453.1 carboxypeptidase regulatory-like domain-containing protein [Flammeovirga sp. EKP202]